MARIRSLKAEFFRNEDISAGGMGAKVLAAGLVCCMADDEGRFKASIGRIKGEVFTHDEASPVEISEWLKYLASIDFITLYEDAGRSYGAILNWKKHQPVPPSRLQDSMLPPPPTQAGRKQGAASPEARSKRVSPSRAPRSDRIGTERIGKGSERTAPAREETPHSTEDSGLAAGVAERADAIGEAARTVLQRDLTAKERATVLGWAHLERGGEPLPAEEVIDVIQQVMTTPTEEGRPPGTLAYADMSVTALVRTSGRRPPPRGRGTTAQSISQARRFEDRAAALRAEGR